MKYAFMSFSTPEMSLAEMIQAAQTYGYDAIEPRAESNHAHGIELGMTSAQCREVKQLFAAGPIDLCCVAISARYANPETTEQAVQSTRRFLDLLAELECPRLRVFGGQFPETLNRADAVKQVGDALASVAPHASDCGVTICMETHDAWCDPDDVAAVMQHANHPNIAVNWDIMHPVRRAGKTMDEAYATLRPWVRHVHVHDGRADEDKGIVPIGEGAIDHRRAIELLLRDGYNGYISGEWGPSMGEASEYLPSELAKMRSFEREIVAAS